MHHQRYLIALVALILSGCGLFSSQNDLEHAKSIAPLHTPPGLNTPAYSEHFNIPNRTYPENAKNVNITPPV